MSEHENLDPGTNEVGRQVYDAAFEVHRELGPGLLESAYRACLAHELVTRGLTVRMEVGLPVVYREFRLELGYRIDLLVEERVLVEVKAVDALHPVHQAQLITYLRLSQLRLGYLINFNIPLIKNGIRRIIL